MGLKKIARALLFPELWIILLLTPVSVSALVCSMVFLGSDSPLSIVSYVLSAYTLTVWCVRIPDVIAFCKKIKNENKLARRWFEDARFRVNVTLYTALIWNVAYAAFQLFLGIRHKTFWFYSLAGYYILLALMRFYLLSYTKSKNPGEDIRNELVRYRFCGWIFLIMNLALSTMVFFMIYRGRTFVHHKITTITMAAYTFTSFTVAIINLVKFRKLNSPAYFATKAIGMSAACVSMLTLESTMLTTFSDGTMDAFTRKLFLALTGGAVSAFILAMAVYMIIVSSKKLKNIKSWEN